jgi:tetratricopeptide (TPR) repeat protein
MSSLTDAIKVAAALRAQKRYDEAIDLIQRALAAAPLEDHARLEANREGLRAAEEAGLPAVARRFADAIAIRDVEGDEEEQT